VTVTAFDERLARIEAGESLSEQEIQELGASPDIVSLGMLADTARRRLRGTQTTYVRVATCAFDAAFGDAVLPAAREVSITGVPPTPAVALSAVQTAKAIAGERAVTGLAWADVERLGAQHPGGVSALLRDLRSAGLEGLAELALDAVEEVETALTALQEAGFERLRLTVDGAQGGSRAELWLRASALQRRFGIIAALNPLPMTLKSFRPTTGYEDVRNVAVARLAAPDIPSIQVDWTRYGPKLAQVALTFGADDIWGVSASDASPEGRRRAAIEEIRRNIEAAGFEPVERDGRYGVIA
jgi:hypothetical protein